VLWGTEILNCKIPNGFYLVIPDKKLKAQLFAIPALDELSMLGP